MAAMLGLIETLRVRDGAIPFLERHLARLARSLAALGLAAPDRDVAELVRPLAGIGEGVLRVEVRDGRASVTVRALPLPVSPHVVTARTSHVAYPHKTTARDAFERAAAEATAAGADDALLLTAAGWVAEGTVWTVCWWEGERVRTPALSLGVLPGIGRARLAELAPLDEDRAPREALVGRSLFLVNAVRGVVALAALDGAAVPQDPRTAEVARRFWPR